MSDSDFPSPDALSSQRAAVLAFLRRERRRLRLMPRNPAHAPIEVEPGQVFAIEGVYCGLVRRG